MSGDNRISTYNSVAQLHAEFERMGFSRHRHGFGTMSTILIDSAELLVAFVTDGDPLAATDDQIARAASFAVGWQFVGGENLVPPLIVALKEYFAKIRIRR